MAVRMAEFGVAAVADAAYGGAVTYAEWWERKRITEGKITKKDLLKQVGFYTYLVIGLAATLNSIFGWVGRGRWGEKISEDLSHGFFYDLPRFSYNTMQNLKSASRGAGESAAVMQARAILAARQQAEQAAAGGRTTGIPYGSVTEDVVMRRGV